MGDCVLRVAANLVVEAGEVALDRVPFGPADDVETGVEGQGVTPPGLVGAEDRNGGRLNSAANSAQSD